MNSTRKVGHAENLPTQVRVSSGTAVVMGLSKGKLDAAPTTAYLMTYHGSRCSANCGFCPQARKSKSKADLLSRVTWPVFETEIVVDGLRRTITENGIKRVCIQALNYPDVFMHLQGLVKAIHEVAKVPISISCQPLGRKSIRQLAESGVQRIGIPLDGATEEVFDRVKGKLVEGPYDWSKQHVLLREAVEIFGKGKVSTHLIVGLGETEQEMVNAIQRCLDMGVLPALFAFTPVQGTALQDTGQPSVYAYRRLQIARYAIVNRLAQAEGMRFDVNGRLVDFGLAKDGLKAMVWSGKPFVTTGCPNCNRPYYNEKPSGPIYNFPKPLTVDELAEVGEEVEAAVE